MKDVLDIHTHTIASGHAYNSMMEMAKSAKEKELLLLGITEHAPNMPGSCSVMYFYNLRVVPREMYGIRILHGVELNILNDRGQVDLEEDVLKQMDLCIASIHPPCFMKGSTKEENTNAVINAIKNPYVNIIGHPDDNRFPLDYEKIVKSAKEYHVLLELNNSSIAPNGFRINSKENILTLLEICKYYQVSVIMSSDAHIFTEIGNHVYVKELLFKTNFPEELVVNQSIIALEDFLVKKC